MANIIWNKFSKEQQDEYIKFLKIFGALSGLFKDNKNGNNADKPYLYYRNHEQLFVRTFSVQDLTREDGSFDALMAIENERIGIGLKTWMHNSDNSYQKIAEFNKRAPTEITPLIEKGTPEEVVKKVSELRNERIKLDKRLHNTNKDVYHFITRGKNVMNIIETTYDLIDIDNIKLLENNEKGYLFEDKKRKYRFNKSKSVLFEQFDASNSEIIEKIDIEQVNDPFEILNMIDLGSKKELLKKKEEIYLPLYQDSKDGRKVSDKSGINIRHSKSKTKGSNKPRPEYEVEVRIYKWIHMLFPNFFGFNALDKNNIKNKNLNDFDLILPDGRVLRGRIKQDNGKSLQTDPQGALGEWILKDVLGLSNRNDVVTASLLDRLGIDSLRIIKEDDKKFRITVGEINSYEKFKLDNFARMKEIGIKGKILPKINVDFIYD